jgi:hypothetical protein
MTETALNNILRIMVCALQALEWLSTMQYIVPQAVARNNPCNLVGA